MTTAQANLYRFLQERVSHHLQNGNHARARRIVDVLTEAVKNFQRPKPPPENLAKPPGVAPGIEVADKDVAANAPSEPAVDHARLRFDILFQAAEAHRESGNLDHATELFEMALSLSQAEPGGIEALEIAHLNHNYASLLDTCGDEPAAESHYQTALELLETLDPQPLEQIANICNNLAMISRNATRLEEAEERYLRALKIFEDIRGEEHLDVATVCNNLGSLYWAWRHPEMARDLHLRALSIRRAQLDDNDPDVGQSACNLAAVYHDLDDFDKASRHYRRGLKILHQHIDSDPDSYEVVARNYADLLTENDREKKANALLKKVEKQIQAAAQKATTSGGSTAS